MPGAMFLTTVLTILASSTFTSALPQARLEARDKQSLTGWKITAIVIACVAGATLIAGALSTCVSMFKPAAPAQPNKPNSTTTPDDQQHVSVDTIHKFVGTVKDGLPIADSMIEKGRFVPRPLSTSRPAVGRSMPEPPLSPRRYPARDSLSLGPRRAGHPLRESLVVSPMHDVSLN